MKSAWLLGAGRVIAMDWVKDRLAMAERECRAETVNIDRHDVYDKLMEMTRGRGPDSCIDAVGAEAHGWGSLDAVVDKVKMSLKLATDRPHVLREMIKCCRKGGTLSIPGVYIGHVDKLPFGALMNKALTVKTGQTHVRRYTHKLLQHIQNGDIDPGFVITHRMRLDEAPEAYRLFRDKKGPLREGGAAALNAAHRPARRPLLPNGGRKTQSAEAEKRRDRKPAAAAAQKPRRQKSQALPCRRGATRRPDNGRLPAAY